MSTPRWANALAAATGMLFVCGAAYAQTCASESEPNNDLESASRRTAAFCMEAMGGAGDQDLVLWQLSEPDTRTRWRLAVTLGPETTARLTLFALTFDTDGETVTGQTKIYDVANVTAEAAIVVPALILRPGTYAIGVAATDGEAGYRLDVTAADPLPAPIDPVAAPAHAGAFSLAGPFGADKVIIPWSIDPEDADSVWTVSLQLPLSTRATLTVEDASGSRIATSSRLDSSGIIWLSDLGLGPAGYRISIAGVREPATALLSAEASGPFDPSHESEPNDDPHHANVFDLEDVQRGRLFSGSSTDDEYFTFTIDEARQGQVFDIVARTPPGVDVQVTLEDADRTGLVSRRGDNGEVRLDNVGLEEGLYYVKLVGPSDERNDYSLSIEERGPKVAGQEWEPNDTPEWAIALGPNDSSLGNFDGRETDMFALVVTGQLQLWRIQAVGDQILELNLHDSSGVSVARAVNDADERIVRLSNLLLAPGTHHISVRGEGDRYLLRALAIGSPPALDGDQAQIADPNAGPIDNADEAAIETAVITNEIEPNGSISRAMPLTFGEIRTGQIISQNDDEYYRFHLNAEERVNITTTAPPGVKIRADLSWGAGQSHVARLENTPLAEAESYLEWEGLLPAGDYYLHITGNVHGMQPYSVLLDRRNFFDRPADLEPNDAWWSAAPMPGSHRLTGNLVAGYKDWYRVPPLAAERSFSAVLAASEQPVEGRVQLEMLAEQPAAEGDSWPKPSSSRVRISGNAANGWEGMLPAGVPLFIGISGDPRPYDVQLTFDGLAATEPQTRPSVSARLDLDQTEVAAFLAERQMVTGTLIVENQSNEALELEIDTHVGDSRWHIDLSPDSVTIQAGAIEEIPIRVDVAPDAWTDLAVAIDIAVHLPGATASVLTGTTIVPTVDGAAAALTVGWPVPVEMLGGLNVAWTAHGAVALDTNDKLNDGLVAGKNAVSWSNRTLVGLDPTLDLAGEDPVPLVGVVLAPAITNTPLGLLRRFRVLTSLDGESFTPALDGELTPRPEAQVFPFAQQIEARFVRLDPIDSHGGDGRGQGAILGDLAVVAAPDYVLAPLGFDIGGEAFGGHPVWTWPQFDARGFTDPAISQPDVRLAADWTDPIEWVLGFYQSRAAQITELKWHLPDSDLRPTNFLGDIEISAATTSPLGPWTALGTWEIELGPDGSVAPFRFDEPIWARYVRFTIWPEPGTRRVHLAEQIRIVERPVNDAYRSILGMWSTNTRAAIYEHLNPVSSVVVEDDDNDTRETADPLALDERVGGTVELGNDQDWFGLRIAESGRLTITLDRDTGLDVALRLYDEFGGEIAFDEVRETTAARHHLAWTQPGSHYIHVVEPPRSLIVTWDTSGSVSAYVDSIFQAVRGFALDISPGLEEVNFVPFADFPTLLLPEWTGDSNHAFATLHAYDNRNYSSSNAELNLLAASNALIEREGVRAALVLTDAESGGFGLTAELWRSLALSNPRIFTVGVRNGQRDRGARYINNMLQDWAFLNDGYYQHLSSEAAVDVAFQRLAAWLRRPAGYAMTASFEAVPPEPGALEVVGGPGALVGLGAIEVILDASGSMLARIDGTRRIAIAKDVLREVVEDILPAGTPFALRVFGQGEPESCETELVARIAPLDPQAVAELIQRIQPTNLAKTPIGESLSLVARDLADVEGPRLIVLLTDGEETCDGDPAAEIDKLRETGFDVRINIVGFAIDDAELSATFDAWATAGGGSYFEATDNDTLRQALFNAMLPAYEVLRGDVLVATGRLDDDALELPPGAYDIRVMTSPERYFDNVAVQPQATTTITVD